MCNVRPDRDSGGRVTVMQVSPAVGSGDLNRRPFHRPGVSMISRRGIAFGDSCPRFGERLFQAAFAAAAATTGCKVSAANNSARVNGVPRACKDNTARCGARRRQRSRQGSARSTSPRRRPAAGRATLMPAARSSRSPGPERPGPTTSYSPTLATHHRAQARATPVSYRSRCSANRSTNRAGTWGNTRCQPNRSSATKRIRQSPRHQDPARRASACRVEVPVAERSS